MKKPVKASVKKWAKRVAIGTGISAAAFTAGNRLRTKPITTQPVPVAVQFKNRPTRKAIPKPAKPLSYPQVKGLLKGTPLEKEAAFLAVAVPKNYGITTQEAIDYFQKQSDLGRKNPEYHNPGALRYAHNGELRRFQTWKEGMAYALTELKQNRTRQP